MGSGTACNGSRKYTRYFDHPNYSGGDGTVDIGAVETQTARILNLTISSSEHSNQTYSFDGVVGSGEQLKTVPVGRIDRISVQFSHDVDVESNDLALIALNRVVNEPTPTLITEPSVDNNFTATWQLSLHWVFKRLVDCLVRVKDSVQDNEGNELDGEWTNPVSLTTTTSNEFPSGNGIPGSNSDFVFTVMPGDATRDNKVSSGDVGIFELNFGQSNKSWGQGDFTGDTVVEGGDYSIIELMFSNTFNWEALSIRGDYDNDYDVDITDAVAFGNYYYGQSPPNILADITGNGIVDPDDISAFSHITSKSTCCTRFDPSCEKRDILRPDERAATGFSVSVALRGESVPRWPKIVAESQSELC